MVIVKFRSHNQIFYTISIIVLIPCRNAKNKWQKNDSGELVMTLVPGIIKQFIEGIDKALVGI